MPLIQWIMQNLGLGAYKLSYTGAGKIVLFGQAEKTGFTETYFSTAIKFQIGSKVFDQFGNAWVVTGINGFSSGEPVYTVKSGSVEYQFSSSQLFVNQIQSDAFLQDRLNVQYFTLERLQDVVDLPDSNPISYQGEKTLYLSVAETSTTTIENLARLQEIIDRPDENPITYQGKRTIKV